MYIPFVRPPFFLLFLTPVPSVISILFHIFLLSSRFFIPFSPPFSSLSPQHGRARLDTINMISPSSSLSPFFPLLLSITLLIFFFTSFFFCPSMRMHNWFFSHTTRSFFPRWPSYSPSLFFFSFMFVSRYNNSKLDLVLPLLRYTGLPLSLLPLYSLLFFFSSISLPLLLSLLLTLSLSPPSSLPSFLLHFTSLSLLLFLFLSSSLS